MSQPLKYSNRLPSMGGSFTDEANRKKIAGDRYVPTFCYQCNAGPDLLKVKVEDGVATCVKPNFDAVGIHPADGRVCVKAFGLIQKAYNPNRVLKPMKRTNPKKGREEDPGFVPISWDEAFEIVAGKLNGIRAKGLRDESGYPRLAVSFGEAATPVAHMGTFIPFLFAWGPVDYGMGAGQGIKCYHSEHLFGEFWHRSFTVTADATLCNYVISLGANSEVSTGVVGVSRNANARARGLKRIQVEPHLSVTGGCSAEWLPIRPKTDPAFLYALIHVLLFEHDQHELDVPFLQKHTASPYLIAPNGYYARDPQSRKPLIWDKGSQRAVPFDSPGIDPALDGEYVIDAIEIGADEELWNHTAVKVHTGFTALKEHVQTCTPQWASEICDLPEEKIRAVANDFLAHAQIGATIEIEGQTLPLRPAAVVLGKTVNNGWGAYPCVWARTVLACLIGGLEVPGGLIGTSTTLNKPRNRVESVRPGEDGFLQQNFNPTDREHWSSIPKARNAYNVLVPLVGDGSSSQALGPTHLPWLFQDEPARQFPAFTLPDMWIVYRTNPAISSWDAPGVANTIASFPFTVAFAYTLDESNYMADILLPDAMDLESTQLFHIGATSYMEQFWKHEGYALRQPVVVPQGEAKEFTEIATELARRTGLLASYNNLINKGLAGVKLSGPNYDYSLDIEQVHEVDDIWNAVCQAASAQLTDGKETDGLDWYKKNGFKVRPFSQLNWYLYPRMVAENLRFELPFQERFSRIGKQLGNRLHEANIHWWDTQLEEYEALPHYRDFPGIWEKAVVDEGGRLDDYPFWLVTTNSMQFAWGSNISLQIIHELASNVGGHAGLVINTNTAAEMGIKNGDMVEITSTLRSSRGRAELRHGIRPDTLLAIGKFDYWATPVAKNIEVPSLNTVTSISLDLTDAMGSGADLVRVGLRKVGT